MRGIDVHKRSESQSYSRHEDSEMQVIAVYRTVTKREVNMSWKQDVRPEECQLFGRQGCGRHDINYTYV